MRHSMTSKLLATYVAFVFLLAVAGPGLAVYAGDKAKEPAKQAPEVVAPAEVAVPDPATEEVVAQPVADVVPEEPVVEVPASTETVVSEEIAPVTAEVAVPVAKATPTATTPTAIVSTSLVEPIVVPGNPALGPGGYRIDPPSSGAYTYGSIEITITVYSTPEGEVFDFVSNTPLLQVVAKGGVLGADVYNYASPGVFSDTGLHAPINPSGFWADLSHIDLYFGTPPVEPETGSITVVKFNDLDGDGQKSESEPTLDGWDFALTLPTGGMLTGTSGADGPGAVLFGELPAGTYSVDETAKPGWHNTTTLPMDVTLAEGEDKTVYVGNAEDPAEDFTKTFELTYNGDIPAETTFRVHYTLGTPPEEVAPAIVDGTWLDLVGTGPFSASVELPAGTIIESVDWYAQRGLEQILLGTTEGETLTEDITNSFTYNGDASGYKFNDLNGDGIWDEGEPGIEGWTIYLYRQVPQIVLNDAPTPEPGFELYATTLTGADGSYHFSGVLPGTYYVAEETREGWDMTVGPEGTFVMVNDQPITGLIFGNHEPFLPFTDIDLAITKAADVATAAPGATITYTLTYRNLGETEATNFTIVDDFDERYVTVLDAAGGVVADGKITWTLAGPLAMADGPQTITYTVKVDSTMPTGTTNVDNTVVINHPDDSNPDNNTDDERVRVTVQGEPFLPFTGGEALLLVSAAILSAGVGALLRRRSA
jgi:uncharacterized repeat protein (TIGR01451 family)